MGVSTFSGLVDTCMQRADNLRPLANWSTPGEDGLFFKNAINLAHGRICSMASWEWLRASTELHVVPVITGTCNVTNGSTAVANIDADLETTTGDMPVSPYAGGYILLDAAGEADIHRISTVADPGDSLVLQEAYQGTNEVGTDFTAFPDALVLPADFGRPLNATEYVTSATKMQAVSPEQFFRSREYDRARYNIWNSAVAAAPAIYTLWSTRTESADKRHILLIAPFTATEQHITIHYYKQATVMSAAADVPLVPHQFNSVLVDFAVAQWHLKKLDLNKYAFYTKRFYETYRRLLSRTDRTSDNAAIQTSRGSDREFYQGAGA